MKISKEYDVDQSIVKEDIIALQSQLISIGVIANENN